MGDIWARVRPIDPIADLDPLALAGSAGVALAVVAISFLWRVTRIGVTLVHELGHAVVGMLSGRTFTGFVLRADMSGHAVTRGKPRGAGIIATTWAGYPAPAIVGAGLIWGATRGWAAPLLTALLVILLLSWLRVRSVLTVLVMLVVSVGGVALWWWRDDLVQVQVLLGVGLVLLVGAWRHLGAVWRGRDTASDAAALARLTPIPRLLWLVSFAVVLIAATALVAAEAHRLLA